MEMAHAPEILQLYTTIGQSNSLPIALELGQPCLIADFS